MDTVYMTGIWDLFHVGHLRVLIKASKLGDRLIVGVATDEFTVSMKPGRPIVPFGQRRDLIFALHCVHDAVSAKGHLDFDAIDAYGVTIRAAGPDYGKYEGEREAIARMEGRGIKIVRLSRTPGISTTAIIERIRNG